jgi:hypothetical protein
MTASPVRRGHVRELGRLSRRLAATERDLNEQIVLAAKAGLTYREIGDAAGVSHVQVLRIVRRSDDARGR